MGAGSKRDHCRFRAAGERIAGRRILAADLKLAHFAGPIIVIHDPDFADPAASAAATDEYIVQARMLHRDQHTLPSAQAKRLPPTISII